MRDEGLHVELTDRNIRAVGKAMPRGYHEREPVNIEHLRHQMLVAGIVTEDTQFKLSVQQLRRDLAGFGAPYLHLYFGKKSTILFNMWNKIQSCRLICPDREASGVIVF